MDGWGLGQKWMVAGGWAMGAGVAMSMEGGVEGLRPKQQACGVQPMACKRKWGCHQPGTLLLGGVTPIVVVVAARP